MHPSTTLPWTQATYTENSGNIWTWFLRYMSNRQRNFDRNTSHPSVGRRDNSKVIMKMQRIKCFMLCCSTITSDAHFCSHSFSSIMTLANYKRHTHPFNGPLSGTTQVSRYQKGKTNVDFTEARDSEWQWISCAICKSAPRSSQITMPAPHHSVFYRPYALTATQPTASKH